MGVLPLLPAAHAVVVQRTDDGSGWQRAPAGSGGGDAGRVRRRADLDLHAQARHHVRAADAGRDRDVEGHRPRVGARGLRHVQRRRVLVLLLHDQGVRRVRGRRRRLHLGSRDAGRLDLGGDAELTHRGPGLPAGHAGVGSHPAAARRPEGPTRRRDGPRRQLGPVPGRDRPVHVRRLRGDGLLHAGQGADARCRIRPRTIDRAGSQPVVVRVDGRSSARVRRPDRDDDRGDGRGHRPEDRLREISTSAWTRCRRRTRSSSTQPIPISRPGSTPIPRTRSGSWR